MDARWVKKRGETHFGYKDRVMVFIVAIVTWAVAASVSSPEHIQEAFAYYSMYRAVKEPHQNLIEKQIAIKGKLVYVFTYILFTPIYPFTFQLIVKGFFILVYVNINFSVMIYGYIRVSSDKQTVENQRFEISNFCKINELTIDDWIEETISGTKNYTKRQLGRLLRKVRKDDIIICSELSRLGRNLFMIMEILNICMTKECKVWTIKDNYRLGEDIQSKVLAFAFGLSAEIERNLISQRTKEALARKKAEGAMLGHCRGFRCRLNPKCANKHDYIVKELAKGTEKTVISKRLKVSKTTLYRYLVYTGLHLPINCQQEGWEEYGIYH